MHLCVPSMKKHINTQCTKQWALLTVFTATLASTSTYLPLQFTLASKLASEAEAVDVGTVEVYRTVQIRQYKQGEFWVQIFYWN